MTGRVGIVGIGIMGTAMMRNLVKDGFEVVGYDIAEVAMARLVESGARPAHRFFASDDPAQFLKLGRRFLGGSIEGVEVHTLG